MTSPQLLFCLIGLVAAASQVAGFQQTTHLSSTTRKGATRVYFFGNKKEEGPVEAKVEEEPEKKGFFGDMKGMMANFDAVVDDFVYKRMGAGEQWYGKRKYNPSGNVEGDYNGMGQSDLLRIEIARVQREEMELLRQRRLEAEENSKRG